MQMLNWNDLRYVLAVSRGGTLRAAARLLGVDDTTVARRLVAMQETIGARLCQRLVDGTLRLTTSGERAALHVSLGAGAGGVGAPTRPHAARSGRERKGRTHVRYPGGGRARERGVPPCRTPTCECSSAKLG